MYVVSINDNAKRNLKLKEVSFISALSIQNNKCLSYYPYKHNN